MTTAEHIEVAMRDLSAYLHEWIDETGQFLVAVYRHDSLAPYVLARGATREEAEVDALTQMGRLGDGAP